MSTARFAASLVAIAANTALNVAILTADATDPIWAGVIVLAAGITIAVIVWARL